MILATQYYRPPFPERKYWIDDLHQIRDAGLNSIQLWACWGWIEAEPGIFRFEDYDELIKEAGNCGLGVIISTVAEIQPFWIEREIPEANMVDCMGNRVISSLRGECNVGLTPGGCTDHPALVERMQRFLTTIAKRYANVEHLLAWDCWNETRWAIQADGYVCYCPSTIKAFREWLRQNYKELEGLNKAWKRRYCRWEDVFPGKLPGRPYTEMMEFLRFLTWRAGQHMKFRYQSIKSEDGNHLITAHCGQPSIMDLGAGFEQTLCRGNDWDLAEQLDGFGASHFPLWGRFEETKLGIRIEAIRSAAGDKVMWVSELQGGSARDGHRVHPAVTAREQQQWLWNGYARGAKAVIFWCWRDEVFGAESSGFGLSGNDGLAGERLRAMKKTANILQKYKSLLESYQPDVPKVGVLFEPDGYYLDWAQYGNSELSGKNLLGYLSALERIHIPYEIVESSHLDILNQLKVLFMPWSLIVRPQAAERLIDFVREGGYIFCEAETDAFTSLGFYRYPGPGRTFISALGVGDKGRREINEETITVDLNEELVHLKCSGWVTPLVTENGDVLAKDKRGEPLLVRLDYGRGKIYVAGTFFGTPYEKRPYPDFESLISAVVQSAKAAPPVKVHADGSLKGLNWRTGISGTAHLLFIVSAGKHKKVTVEGPGDLFHNVVEVEELISGEKITIVRNGKHATMHVNMKNIWAILRW